jgi:hypothetical protein
MVIFFQVGCFYEFCGEINEIASIPCRNDTLTLNLKRLPQNKRGVLYGFPVRLEEEYAKRLLK